MIINQWNSKYSLVICCCLNNDWCSLFPCSCFLSLCSEDIKWKSVWSLSTFWTKQPTVWWRPTVVMSSVSWWHDGSCSSSEIILFVFHMNWKKLYVFNVSDVWTPAPGVVGGVHDVTADEKMWVSTFRFWGGEEENFKTQEVNTPTPHDCGWCVCVCLLGGGSAVTCEEPAEDTTAPVFCPRYCSTSITAFSGTFVYSCSSHEDVWGDQNDLWPLCPGSSLHFLSSFFSVCPPNTHNSL